jgi:hypothetical protein
MALYIPFDSVEAMLDFQQKARNYEDSIVKDWQRELKPGSYFATYEPHFDMVIYNEVLEDKPEPGDAPLLENSRLIRAYSVIEPDGELGLTHVARAEGPLTKKQFEMARLLNWPANPKHFAVIVAGDHFWTSKQNQGGQGHER